MARFCVQLQLYDKSPARWISPREALQLIESGEALRVKRKAHSQHEIVRLKTPVQPSDSQETACSITETDSKINATVIDVAPAVLEIVRDKIAAFKASPLTIIEAPIPEVELVFTERPPRKPPKSSREP